MVFLRTNKPPIYDHERSRQENFDEFFGWALGIKNAIRKVPEIADRAGLGMRQHPLGFWVVYLSERYDSLIENHPSVANPGCTGIARANFYPPGEEFRDDIHSHGFDSTSGCADGILLNMRHFPDFSGPGVEDGEGLIGYQSTVGIDGVNRTQKVTAATIPVPRSELQVLEVGDTFAMRRQEDWHSIAAAPGLGALSIFAKESPIVGQDGQSMMLVRPDGKAPPAEY